MKSLKERMKAVEPVEAVDLDDGETDPNAPIPGTVFNERQARILRNVVIIMGLMLIGGFALLIGIIAYRASQPATISDPVAPAGVQVPQAGFPSPSAPPQIATGSGSGPKSIEGFIPKGSTYLNSTISGNRLVLTLQMPNRDLKLVLIDLNSWQIAGQAILKQRK